MVQMLVYAVIVGVLAGLECWFQHAEGVAAARPYDLGLVAALGLGVAWAGASLQLVDRMLQWAVAAAILGLVAGAGMASLDQGPILLWGTGGAGTGLIILGLIAYHRDLLEAQVEGQAYLVVSLGAAIVAAMVGAEFLTSSSQGLVMSLVGGVVGGVVGAFGGPMYMAREKEQSEENDHPGGW